MTVKSRLKVERPGMVVFAVFYAVAGLSEFFVLFLSGLRLFPAGVLGFLSLTAAYGLIKMRRWAVWLVAVLFFLGTTFGATTLGASITTQTFNPNLDALSLHLGLIAYLIMTAVASIYVLSKRGGFQ